MIISDITTIVAFLSNIRIRRTTITACLKNEAGEYMMVPGQEEPRKALVTFFQNDLAAMLQNFGDLSQAAADGDDEEVAVILRTNARAIAAAFEGLEITAEFADKEIELRNRTLNDDGAEITHYTVLQATPERATLPQLFDLNPFVKKAPASAQSIANDIARELEVVQVLADNAANLKLIAELKASPDVKAARESLKTLGTTLTEIPA